MEDIYDWDAYIMDEPDRTRVFLEYLMSMMPYRVKTRTIKNHPHIFLMIDEVMDVNEQIPDLFPRFMKQVSRDGRKAKIHVTAATQSDRVKQTGFTGVADLIRGYARVELYYDQITKIWTAEYNLGGRKGFHPAIPPGPYDGPVVKGKLLKVSSLPPVYHPLVKTSVEDLKIEQWIKLVQSGVYKSDATRKIYNREFGGNLAPPSPSIPSVTVEEGEGMEEEGNSDLSNWLERN
jgi:hypothetical protein